VVANKRISDEFVHLMPSGVTSLIDVGCGDGVYTIELATLFPEIHVDGFDPADDAISVALDRNTKANFFVADLLNENELPNKKYDMAVVRGVLHHLPTPRQEEALRNCAKFADRMMIMEPNGNNPILKVIEKVSPYHKAHQEQSFRSAVLQKWCENAGWKVEELRYIGFVPFFCPTLLAKVIYFFQPFLERIPYVRDVFGAQIIIYCTKKSI
jgi:2-polyprenyl-3-methyl-5-hydroxy-6-metoxy-1,4-benzoquinol methylase